MKLSPFRLAREKKGWSLARLSAEAFRIDKIVSAETLRRLERQGPKKIAYGHVQAAAQLLTDSQAKAEALMVEAAAFNYEKE